MENKLVENLKALPLEIHQHRQVLIGANNQLELAKATLAKKESELLVSGVIDGKNAEIRKAQLSEATAVEQQAVQEAAQCIEQIKADLYHAEDRFRALRSIALVLSKEVTTIV